ncbi:carnitine acetyl transferase [Chytriomyces sp. MP71]|nr:carnitine acetyl transferase [Chytriomyces sp. MP71]
MIRCHALAAMRTPMHCMGRQPASSAIASSRSMTSVRGAQLPFRGQSSCLGPLSPHSTLVSRALLVHSNSSALFSSAAVSASPMLAAIKKPKGATVLTPPKPRKHDLKRRILERIEAVKPSKVPHINRQAVSLTASKPHLPTSTTKTDDGAKNLFKFQRELPKLPIPTLKETCITYLRSIRPLVSDEEYEDTVRCIGELLVPGGFGEQLQERLMARDRATSKNWLIDWWNSLAYMSYRDPVAVFVSYYYCFQDNKALVHRPAARAAELIAGAMQFRDLVVSEALEPDFAKKQPLCSNQYQYMFNSTRIPQLPEDVTRMSDPNRNNHIVVARKNQFFQLNLVANGRRLSTPEIEQQLQRIYHLADTNSSPSPAVGVLTTLDRDSWTVARNNLLSVSDKNRKSLDAIETSAFAICLDDSTPVTLEDRAMTCWVGDGKNRMFDKSLQFIVCDNGAAGFNGEHSMIDGSPTLRLCDWILDSLAKGKIDHGFPTGQHLVPPTHLEFDLSPTLQSDISSAVSKFNELKASQKLTVIPFDAFGKNGIKSLRCSPDAFVQMAIQNAYFKTFGTFVATYEAAQTRKFAYGRTETGRTLSVESTAWVRAMQDSSVTSKEKAGLGRRAMQAQSAYLAMACEGKGVDRHLFGLKLLVREGEEMPRLFLDPAYARSTKWTLSTSQISSEYFNGIGFGEVVPDGYGIGYQIKGDSLQFTITSKRGKNEELGHLLLESLREMHDLFSKH